MKRHLREKHGFIDNIQKQKNFGCSKCEKKFYQKKDMLRHLRNIHKDSNIDTNSMDTNVSLME